MSVTIKKRRVRLTEIARDIGLDWPIITYAISSNSNPAVSKKKRKKKVTKHDMKMFLMLDPPTTTAQMKKIGIVHGKPYVYTPENVKKAKDEIIKHLAPLRPKSPLLGPLELRVNWLFDKGKRHKHLEWRVTKPDTDNLEKLLKDCMTELGFWKDDAQVVKEYVDKIWSSDPVGIAIEIIELDKFKEVDFDEC